MIFAIASFVVPLGFDTFAIAIALGLRGARPLVPALTFTGFEALMPLVGLFLGRLAGARFQTPAVLCGGIVLVVVGLSMVKEALEEQDDAANLRFASVRTALLAGFAISMDEFAIGFPMGVSGLPVPQTISAIAIQTFVVTCAGIFLGQRLSARRGHRTSRGVALIAAAAFVLLGGYLIAGRFVHTLPQP